MRVFQKNEPKPNRN